jgi:hypothetical protein
MLRVIKVLPIMLLLLFLPTITPVVIRESGFRVCLWILRGILPGEFFEEHPTGSAVVSVGVQCRIPTHRQASPLALRRHP